MIKRRSLALLVGAFLPLLSLPTFAAIRAPGVSVALLREIRGGKAMIEVKNSGSQRGKFLVEVLDKNGQVIDGYKASATTFSLSRDRSKKVRLSNLPPTTYALCASVSATSSLRLRSCAPHQR